MALDDILTRVSNILRSLPEFNALGTLLVFVFVPAAFFGLISALYRCSLNKRRDDSQTTFVYAMGYTLRRHAGLISFIVFIWSLASALFQAVYVNNHLTLGTEITYYLQVNLPEYEGVSNIDSAQNLNSFNLAMLNWQGMPWLGRRNDTSEGKTKQSARQKMLKTKKILEQRNLTERSISKFLSSFEEHSLQSSSSQTLSIVYHTSDWDNVLTEQRLVDICLTEQALMREIDCVNTYQYKSMMPSTFHIPSCSYLATFEKELPQYGLVENEAYVADGTSSTYPRSDILISFFKTGSCTKLSEDTLDSLFASVAAPHNLEITYVSEDIVQNEFDDAIIDAVFYSIVTLILCTIFLVVGVRGFVLTFTTLFCILISVVHAAALLPYWNYGAFSAFNVLSVFILIGVGANAVLMFGSAWRRVVPRGKKNDKSASVEQVLEAYQDVMLSILFTTTAACLSLFSKLASPVIVISQLGAFLGVSVVVFYVMFHMLIVPMWVFSARFALPVFVHELNHAMKKKCLALLSSLCCVCVSFYSWVHEGNATQEQILVDSFLAMPTSHSRAHDSSFSPMSEGRHSLIEDEEHRERVEREDHRSASRTERREPSRIRDRKCCRLSLLAWTGIISVLCTLFGLLLVYYFVRRDLSVDFGIPQLFDPNTNIGESMYIVKSYKSDIFTMHDSSVNAAPTSSPVYLVPSFAPTPAATRAPTMKPTATRSPTAIPTMSRMPSFVPTLVPTHAVQPTPKSSKHADYTVTGCWGIYADKAHMDSEAELSFHANVFEQYTSSPVVNGQFTQSGALADMKSMCEYIAANRDSLDVHPDWVKERDCIYDQVVRASQSSIWKQPTAPPYTVNNVLVYWASQDYVAGGLLGVDAPYRSSITPLWLCFNVSARTDGVSTLTSDEELAVTLSDRWTKAFANHGVAHAKQVHLPYIIGSTEFTFPMLAAEVLWSIELAAIITLGGFVVLLFAFTGSDLGLTVLGTLAMATVIAVSVCVHEHMFVGDLDLLDVVVLIAVMGMAVDFPIHFIMEFVHQRDKAERSHKRRQGRCVNTQRRSVEGEDTRPSAPLLIESEQPQQRRNRSELSQHSSGLNPDFVVEEGAEYDEEVDEEHAEEEEEEEDFESSWLIADQLVNAAQQSRDRQQGRSREQRTQQKESWSISPVLARAHKYLFGALVAPLVMTVLSGLPLLRAEFQLLRKCGQYLVILAVVSYVFCVVFLPYYMALGFKVTCCQKKENVDPLLEYSSVRSFVGEEGNDESSHGLSESDTERRRALSRSLIEDYSEDSFNEHVLHHTDAIARPVEIPVATEVTVVNIVE